MCKKRKEKRRGKWKKTSSLRRKKNKKNLKKMKQPIGKVQVNSTSNLMPIKKPKKRQRKQSIKKCEFFFVFIICRLLLAQINVYFSKCLTLFFILYLLANYTRNLKQAGLKIFLLFMLVVFIGIQLTMWTIFVAKILMVGLLTMRIYRQTMSKNMSSLHQILLRVCKQILTIM